VSTFAGVAVWLCCCDQAPLAKPLYDLSAAPKLESDAPSSPLLSPLAGLRASQGAPAPALKLSTGHKSEKSIQINSINSKIQDSVPD